MTEKELATYVVLGIATAGIISTTALVMYTQKLTLSLKNEKLMNAQWKKTYRRAIEKMTPQQMIAELQANLNNIKFMSITKDL